MLKKENVWIKDFSSKEEIFEFIAKQTNAKNSDISVEEVVTKLKQREDKVSTGFEDGIAIPHGKIENLSEPIINVIKTTDINWPSMDGQGTNFVICILVPIDGGSDHLKILGEITRKLVSKNFRDKLKSASEEEIVSLINGVFNDKVFIDTSEEDFYLGVTKCPLGIAHTYLAAEKLQEAANDLGVNIKVETQGTAGIENKITTEDIKKAKGVIIVADAKIEGKNRFVGKNVLEVPIKDSLSDAKSLFTNVKSAKKLESNLKEIASDDVNIKKPIINGNKIKQYLLTGTSHMIPFIVAGGIIFSLSVMLSGQAATPETGFLGGLAEIGGAGLALFVPVLAGYIAYAICEKPGLAPGMIGGYLAVEVGAGFLGGIFAGFLAGFVVYQMKKIKLPTSMKSLGSIFLYPLFGTLIVGIVMVFIVGQPIANLMEGLTNWLNSMSDAGKVPLGAILGGMTAFDMGGPINKVATLFAQTQVDTLPYLMGGVGVAICVPPIGMGIASLLSPKKYTTDEKEAGKAAILMGFVGITEGAIPFAAGDPLRVIPSICIGSAVGTISAFLLGAINHAPWGGIIVLPVVEGRLVYVFSILLGAIVTALLVNFLKKPITEDYLKGKEDKIIELNFERF